MGWYHLHKGEYEQALSSVKKADELGNFNGKKINLFAQSAITEGKMDLAAKAYDYILSMGKESSEYLNTLTNKINLLQKVLEQNPKYTQKDVNDLIQTYENYFEDYPQTKITEAYKTYASVLARYTDDIQKAINALESFTAKSNVNMLLKNKAKLDLGDYHLIAGNNWQSTLIYSQVDKEYKNDALGEEARFRNAKLSYYIGDYVWAQGQLDILKSSTSELIANDALNLSVLITENTPMDSNYTPLEMYSRADLLIFRNKYKQASDVLDSLASQYPDNPLADDILMARASIATKQQDFTQAVGFYKQVYEKHNEDILADDALFKAAVIQEQYLNNPKEAQFLYEKIILDYSNSTLIGEARKSFRRLRGDGIQ
jgi:tetratricopeptide (TPR) repeat protein